MNVGIDAALSAQLTALVVGFALVLCRVSAFVVVAPLFSARFLSPRVRVGVALSVSFVAFIGAGSPTPSSWDYLVVVRETALGLVMGLVARATIEAALALGQIFSGQIGFAFASTVDPLAGHQSDAVSDLVAFLALALSVAMGLHREAIALLCASVQHLPPGGDVDVMAFVQRGIEQMTATCALAARLSFPLLATTSAGYVAMGFIGKGAPQLGVQGLGFTIPVVAGGFALYALAPPAAELAARAAVNALRAFVET